MNFPFGLVEGDLIYRDRSDRSLTESYTYDSRDRLMT